MAHLLLCLLGTPVVRHGQQRVNFRTRKTHALLLYLAVEEGMHTREKLTALFWPASNHTAGRASLRNALHSLSRVLHKPHKSAEDPHLLIERDAIGFNFNADFTLDLCGLEEAVSIMSSNNGIDYSGTEQLAHIDSVFEDCRGEFMEGFNLVDAPRFDDWLSFQRERWHLRMTEFLARLSEAQSEQGAIYDAISTLQRWQALDPLDEQVYRQLIHLHLARGERREAKQWYDACCAMLDAEFGASPAPETEQLVIHLQDPSQVQPRRLRARRDANTLPDLQVVGRGPEHARLVDLFHRTRKGESLIAIIEGEAGIGKTSLAATFARWTTGQGALTLQAKAFETGGRLPYQPVVEILRPLLRPASAVIEQLETRWLAELTSILPDLLDTIPDLPSAIGDETTARNRLFEAAARAVAAAAREQPLLLLLDDIQWADSATLDLLFYACRYWHSQQARILCLFTLRTEALMRIGGQPANPTLFKWQATMTRALSPAWLKLGLLTKADTAKIVQRLVDDANAPQLTHWLFAQTKGQPFYLSESLKALLAHNVLQFSPAPGDHRLTLTDPSLLEQGGSFVAPGIREVVSGRIARLSPQAFRLLAAGSVFGQGFSFRDLCAVTGLAVEASVPALDELISARLLDEQPAQPGCPYTFTHDKIRDVVYTEAGDARRRLFHESVLQYLQSQNAPSARLAHHAREAAIPASAFHFSIVAGDEAIAKYAVHDAVEQYQKARQLLADYPSLGAQVSVDNRSHLWAQLGRAYELVDEWDEAAAAYRTMLHLAQAEQIAEMEVSALNRLANVTINNELDIKQAQTWFYQAQQVALRTRDTAGAAEAAWGLARTYFYSGHRAQAETHGEQALALARKTGQNELIARCLNILSYALHGPAPLSRATAAHQYAKEAYQLFDAQGNQALAADSLAMMGSTNLHSGGWRSALAFLRQSLSISQEIDNLWGQGGTAFTLAVALLDGSQLGEALAVAEQGVTAAHESGTANLLGATYMVRGTIYRALHDAKQALADHQQAEIHFASTPNPHTQHVMAPDLCADYALLGQWTQAYRQARRIHASPEPFIIFSGFAFWTVAASYVQTKATIRAEEITSQFATLIGDNPRYGISLHRARALIAEFHQEWDVVIEQLLAALHLSDTLELGHEQWQICFELARVYEVQNQEGQADRARERGVAIVHRLAQSIDDTGIRTAFLKRVL